MPTVLRSGPFRLFFYAGDGKEPPHIHIERDNKTAKYWLLPVLLHQNNGFSTSELGQILAIIKINQQTLLEGWHDFFGKQDPF